MKFTVNKLSPFLPAALDDGDEGDEDEREDLEHGPGLPHPGRHVVVGRGGRRPVEHLVKVASLEGEDAEDHQAYWNQLEK